MGTPRAAHTKNIHQKIQMCFVKTGPHWTGGKVKKRASTVGQLGLGLRQLRVNLYLTFVSQFA